MDTGCRIASILMSRFILNLRTLDQSPVLTSISVDTQAATSVRFASGPFDNLGAPLDVDDENLRELDEEEGNEEEESLIAEGWYDSGTLNEYHAVKRSDSLDLDESARERLDHA